MMKRIKTGMKLVKFGHGFIANIAVGIFFELLGILMLFIGAVGIPLAILFVVMGPLMLIQIQYTLLCSGMVTSSSQRRLLEVKLPDFLSLVTGVFGYVVAAVVAVIWMRIRPEMIAQSMSMLICGSIIIALILMFMGIAYKWFWGSYILFMMGYFVALDGGDIMLIKSVEVNVIVVFAISLMIVLVGVGISALLRRALYKKPLSKMAVGASLRKVM